MGINQAWSILADLGLLLGPVVARTGPNEPIELRLDRPNPSQLSPIRAVEIALERLAAKDMLVKGDFRLTVVRGQAHWSVWVQSLPLTPGLDATVSVFDDGKVDILVGM